MIKKLRKKKEHEGEKIRKSFLSKKRNLEKENNNNKKKKNCMSWKKKGRIVRQKKCLNNNKKCLFVDNNFRKSVSRCKCFGIKQEI